MIDIFKYAKLQGKKISVTCTDKEKVTGVWTDYIYEDEDPEGEASIIMETPDSKYPIMEILVSDISEIVSAE